MSGEKLTVELSYPPTVNQYWRNWRGRMVISARGREYRKDVVAEVKSVQADRGFKGRLRIEVELHVPDRRRRDIDNVLKSLLDALQHAGVYRDDEQIDELEVVRYPKRAGGAAVVSVTTLQDENTCGSRTRPAVATVPRRSA